MFLFAPIFFSIYLSARGFLKINRKFIAPGIFPVNAVLLAEARRVAFRGIGRTIFGEDSYSNLLGTRIGVEALNDKEHSYNKAVEIAIKKELKNPGLLPGDAANSVKRHCPLR